MHHHHDEPDRHRRHGRRDRERRADRPTASDVMTVVESFGATLGDAADLLRRTLEPPTRSPGFRPRRHRPRFDDRCCDDGDCGECRTCECQCTCCVCDADLVVYARLGEVRVVPIRLENERRREREIELDLAPFTTRGGGATPVRGAIVGPTGFTLEACSEREVIVVVTISDNRLGQTPAAAAYESRTRDELLEEARKRGIAFSERATKAELVEELKRDDQTDKPQRPPRAEDVDDCHVATSDLRIIGCDVRPIAIAVAVLPRSCGPYEVGCGCGCC